MLDSLTDKLASVVRNLGSKGRITEADIDSSLRDVRLALLEADVNFKVAKEFADAIREKALGADVLKGVSPGQQVIKIVHDEIISLLGGGAHELKADPSGEASVILLVGLQGSGKTTTAAKLALHLRKLNQKSVLVASDLRRPAAADQLEALGKQLDIPVHRARDLDENPETVAVGGVRLAQTLGARWAIVDTSGRLQIDDALMDELLHLKARLVPAETLLVIDAMTGQEALATAATFNERIGLTGLMLSKLDGDSRGGAALSATKVTGLPIKFMGTGEKPDALEPFFPDRMASRILGMGDVVSLVERAQEQIDSDQAAELERKFRRAEFDLEDFLTQLRQLQKMGSFSSILDMIPGGRNLRSRMPTGDLDDKKLRRTEAMICSMTPWERRHPGKINGSRRKRIANGSGSAPSDINQLLNQFRQMQKMMKQMTSGKRKGLPMMNLPRA